jgi:hypothetical protein
MLRGCATSHQKPEIKALDETLICATRAASGKLVLRQPAETQRDGQIRRVAADDHSSDQRNDEGESRREGRRNHRIQWPFGRRHYRYTW